MKRLKTKLDDNKVYTFQTFSINESNAMRRIYREIEFERKALFNRQFKCKVDGELELDSNDDPIPLNLTKTQYEDIDAEEFKLLKKMASTIQKSIIKNHPDFANTEGIDKLCDLIDNSQMRTLLEFAFFGRFVIEPEEIDATKWMTDEQK